MKEIKKWMDKAERDLSTAKFNFDGKFYEVAAFFSQQAVEKGLKALYIKKFKKIKKVHDLVALAEETGLPEEFVETCRELTAAYFYTRYPDIPEEKNMKEFSAEFIEKAGAIIEWIKKQLGE